MASVYSMAKPNCSGSLAKRSTSVGGFEEASEFFLELVVARNEVEDSFRPGRSWAGPRETRRLRERTCGFEQFWLQFFDHDLTQRLHERLDRDVLRDVAADGRDHFG